MPPQTRTLPGREGQLAAAPFIRSARGGGVSTLSLLPVPRRRERCAVVVMASPAGKLGQNFNLAGVRLFLRVVLVRRGGVSAAPPAPYPR